MKVFRTLPGISGRHAAMAILFLACMSLWLFNAGCSGGSQATSGGGGGSTTPSITNLNPASGPVGTQVTIAGTNFGASQGSSTIKFNGIPATPTNWGATSIVAPVPTGATNGNVVVTVGGTASNGVPFTVPTTSAPSISNLTPNFGPIGTSVTINGANFGATQGTSTISFNGTLATPTSWSPSSIVTPVPTGAINGNVVVTVGGTASNGVAFTVSTTSSPTITSLSPNSGAAGTPVTITGTNFGASQGLSTITFNGIAATPTSWSATSIVAPVPAGATTGNVVVTVGGVASNGMPFTLPTSSTSSWRYVQDSVMTFCSGSAITCTLQTGNLIPTTAGTVWVIITNTTNPVTISNVTGGGGTWVICAACHVYNATLGRSLNIAYNLTGAPGTSLLTVNLSGISGTVLSVKFMEVLPPAGSVASFDAAGTAAPTPCTTCTGVGLTLTGTDAIIQAVGANSPNIWNAWSSPYTTLPVGEGLSLNATDGTAPTVKLSSSGAVITAIAFKSSLGSFTPPTLPISVVNFTNPTGISCNPSCSLTIPATGQGNLLYVEAANSASSFISSISNGGTWVVPAASNTCRLLFSGGNALSCGYALSSMPGVTSLIVKLTGSANTSFAVWEIATTTAPFAFDAQGSATNSASFNPSGVSLPLTGSNDVIFQSIFVPGGTSSVSLYPMPRIPGQGTQFLNNNAANAVRLNTTDGTAPKWINQQNSATAVTGVAFKSSGGVGPLSASVALATAATSTNGSATSELPPVPTRGAMGSAAFPIKASANGRYFVDATGAPWLMVGDSARHIVNVVLPTDWPTYFASRQALGFNTVNIMSCSHGNCPPTGATADGQLPFTGTIASICGGASRSAYDLATPNSQYWAEFDSFVDMAAAHGQVVLFNPLNTADFMHDLRVSGPTKAFSFGAYLGNRYKNFPNVIWELGSDFHTGTRTGATCPGVVSDNTLVQQVMAGIASTDPNHISTIQLDYTRSYSNEDSAMVPYLSANALYTYNETYDHTLQAYNSTPVSPVFLAEANMEGANDANKLSSLANALVIRRQMYWTMTSGAAGYIWGNAYVNQSNLTSPTWQSQLNTLATNQVTLLTNLFKKYPWWTLVPDQSHQVVTGGFGTPNPNNRNLYNASYATTALNTNGTLAITYTPVSTTLSVNMANFSKPMTAFWYDPTTGNLTAISGSPFANSGSQSFTTPSMAHSDGSHDWVLVLQ